MLERSLSAAAETAEAQLKQRPGWLAGGSVVGAILASSCCILPVVLFSFGIGGAWMGNLTALGSYQPVFVALTLLLLAAGFYSVYRRPRATCSCDGSCEPKASPLIKVALWTSTLLIVLALAWPYLAPYIFS